ncbi:MAG: peptidoglycan-binding protein [Candidatus Liptonbacteria bacterium]|nr:peptidoglycan-binding protein [Candidatus Liptonbacteria bacterium]
MKITKKTSNGASKKLIAVSVLVGVLAVGFLLPQGRVLAQDVNSSLEALQKQVSQLLEMIKSLQAQIEALRGGITPVVPRPIEPDRGDEAGFTGFIAKKVYPAGYGCAIPMRVKIGYKGDDVKIVQQYLATDKQIYPEGLVTGYYGNLTKKALGKFQEKHGLNQTGEFDEDTKNKLEGEIESDENFQCPPRPIPPPKPIPDQGIKVYSPSNGEVWMPGQTYKITWSQVWPTIKKYGCFSQGEGKPEVCIDPPPISSGTASSTFAPIGPVRITLHHYIACLYEGPVRCMIAEAMPYVISEKTDNDGVFEWTVPADLAEQYRGKMVIVVEAVGGGMSGRSAVFVIGSNVLPDNQLKVFSPSAGETWYKGKTYEVKWTEPLSIFGMVRIAGTVRITLGPISSPCYDRCPLAPSFVPYTINASAPNVGFYDWTIPNDLPSWYVSNNMAIYVSVNGTDSSGQSGLFTIAEISGSNLPPVVTGVSGPTSLKVGETGAWTVKAYDPENGSLSYSVIWGDEPATVGGYNASVSPATPVQNTATFTHIYNASGTFNPIFNVMDDKGQKAKTSMTVVVQ